MNEYDESRENRDRRRVRRAARTARLRVRLRSVMPLWRWSERVDDIEDERIHEQALSVLSAAMQWAIARHGGPAGAEALAVAREALDLAAIIAEAYTDPAN